MTQNSVLEMVLRFKTDDAAQRKALKSTAEIEQRIDALTASLGQMNPATRAAVTSLIQRFDALGVRIEERQDEVKALVREMQRLDDVRVSPRIDLETGRQAVGDFSTTFGAASSALGGVGALSGVGDILGFVEYIPLAVQGLTALNPVMLALTGIVGGVTLGIAALNAEQEAQKKRVEETAEALQKEADARRNLLGAIGTGDPGQLNVRAAELRAEINTIRQEQLNPLLSQQNDLRLRALDAARQTFPNLDPNSDQIRTFAANAAASMAEGRALQEQIDAVLGQLTPLTEQLTDLEDAGARGAAILRGINEPLQELKSMGGLQGLTTPQLRQRQMEAMATVNAYAQAIANAQAQIDQARRDGNLVLVDALQIEKAKLESGFDTAQAELDLLNTRGEAIAVINDATEAERKRAEAISKQTDNYFKATEDTVKAQEAVFKAQQNAQSVYDKYMADTLEISRKAAEQEQEILADGSEKRADILQKTEEQIAKLERDSGRDRFNAIAARDALALYLASQKEDDSLADAKKAQADQLKEQEKAQGKQLDSLRKSIQQQAAARDTQYRNEQALAAQASISAQAQLMNAKNAEIQIAMYGSNGVRTIMSNMWGQLTIETVNGVNAILTQTRRLVGGIGYGGTSFGATNLFVNGVNESSPAAYDLAGLPPPQTRTVQRVVDQRLDTYFSYAGYSR